MGSTGGALLVDLCGQIAVDPLMADRLPVSVSLVRGGSSTRADIVAGTAGSIAESVPTKAPAEQYPSNGYSIDFSLSLSFI